jgi:NADH dehydrogenase
MKDPKKIAITGAFSYTGKYIARRLLEEHHQLITLTGNPDRPDPFDGRIPAFPFHFSDPEKLVKTLAGVDILINTYWVRFDFEKTTFFSAISNLRRLFRAASQAGVRRVIHISITNPDPYSKLPYFWGKAILEEDLIHSGLSYAILRPTVIFGKEDILIHNIAWFLRRFPLFPIPGDGKYRLQPVFVDDLAALAVQQVNSEEKTIIDAIGPETYTFNELVDLLRRCTGSKALRIHTPPMLAWRLSNLMGKLVQDVVLTREEVTGLMEERLYVDAPPAGQTRFSEWVHQNADDLGKRYAHELDRHYKEK